MQTEEGTEEEETDSEEDQQRKHGFGVPLFCLSQQGFLLQLSLWHCECVILVLIKLSVKSVMQRPKEPGSRHPGLLSYQKRPEQLG